MSWNWVTRGRDAIGRGLNWVARSVSQNLSLSDPDDWQDLFPGMMSASGERVSRRTALTLSGLFRGVALISGTVGKIPCYCWQGSESDKSRDKSHPAHKLVRWDANSELTAFSLRETMTAHAILQGNGYAYIKRGPDGRPLRLNLLLPDRTYPVRLNGQLWYVTSIGGTLDDPQSHIETIHPDNILHIHGLGYDGLTGYSVLELGCTDIGASIAKTKHEAAFFKNAATPTVVIQVPTKMSDAAYTRLRATWQKSRPGGKGGLSEAHETALLEEGATANPMSITAADAQLIESSKFDLVKVANWLQLAPHKVGADGRSAYASLEQENQATLDEAFDVWFVRWELEYRRKLLTEEEKASESHFFEFIRDALLRSNLAARAAYYRMATGGRPWLTQNEVRQLENRKPMPNGDVILDPLNMGKPGGDPAAPVEPTPAPEPTGEPTE